VVPSHASSALSSTHRGTSRAPAPLRDRPRGVTREAAAVTLPRSRRGRAATQREAQAPPLLQPSAWPPDVKPRGTTKIRQWNEEEGRFEPGERTIPTSKKWDDKKDAKETERWVCQFILRGHDEDARLREAGQTGDLLWGYVAERFVESQLSMGRIFWANTETHGKDNLTIFLGNSPAVNFRTIQQCCSFHALTRAERAAVYWARIALTLFFQGILVPREGDPEGDPYLGFAFGLVSFAYVFVLTKIAAGTCFDGKGGLLEWVQQTMSWFALKSAALIATVLAIVGITIANDRGLPPGELLPRVYQGLVIGEVSALFVGIVIFSLKGTREKSQAIKFLDEVRKLPNSQEALAVLPTGTAFSTELVTMMFFARFLQTRLPHLLIRGARPQSLAEALPHAARGVLVFHGHTLKRDEEQGPGAPGPPAPAHPAVTENSGAASSGGGSSGS